MTSKHMVDRLVEAENDIFKSMVDLKIGVASMSPKFPPTEEEVREMKAAVQALDKAYYRLLHARLDIEFGQ